ncbi:MAG: ATP-binding cassette domain-containing protein [Dehalococcoidia bacterium]|nr:ATP-binding cassette domain-containing protein [Dehalococcoidia bacterium]
MLTASDTAIEFHGVSKRFSIREKTLMELLPRVIGGRDADAFYALRDVSFKVERGKVLGIIGRNGGGKSTTLKLIAGVMVPTRGEVSVRGRVSPLIELGAGFHPELTGRDNIFLNGSILGLSWRQIRERFDEIVEFAGLAEFIDTPVKRYSSGMYGRLGFSVAIHCEPEILLVDEVMAVGDLTFQKKCEERMSRFRDRGVTIVLVTHGLELVKTFCDRALLYEEGRVLAGGEPTEVVDAYLERTHEQSGAIREKHARTPTPSGA